MLFELNISKQKGGIWSSKKVDLSSQRLKMTSPSKNRILEWGFWKEKWGGLWEHEYCTFDFVWASSLKKVGFDLQRCTVWGPRALLTVQLDRVPQQLGQVAYSFQIGVRYYATWWSPIATRASCLFISNWSPSRPQPYSVRTESKSIWP